MVAKLKFTLKQTPWSLLLKSGIFGASWMLFSAPITVLIGLALYFFPFFQPHKLGWPFFVVMLLSVLISPQTSFGGVLFPNLFGGFLFGLLFFLVIGIKDLVFFRRGGAYELLLLFLLFLISLRYFSGAATSKGGATFFLSAIVAALFFFLVKSYLEYEGLIRGDRHALVALGVATLLVWQCAFLLLFLPFSFFNQGALLFLLAALLIEFLREHLRGGVVRERIMANFFVVLSIIVVIFLTTQWSL